MSLESLKRWVREHKILAALSAAVSAILGLFWIGSSLVINGVLAGLLISGAVGILVYKIGTSENTILQRVYKTIVEHPLMSDVGITLLAFVAAPAGITGWLSAAVAGLLGSVWLLIAHNSMNTRVEVIPCLVS